MQTFNVVLLEECLAMPLKPNFLKPMSAINAMICPVHTAESVYRKQYMLVGYQHQQPNCLKKELDLDPELMTCNVTMQCRARSVVYHASKQLPMCANARRSGIGGVFMFERMFEK